MTIKLSLLVLLAVGLLGWDTSFQIRDESHAILTITNWEECKAGKVRCWLWLDPNDGPIVVNEKDKQVLEICRDRMEAAMRAMEPYLPSTTIEMNTTEYVVVDLCKYDLVCQAKERVKALERINKALDEWEAVKRDCWRTP